MNGRQGHERQKALLLRQIQQRRLELSTYRRHWLGTIAPLDRGQHTLLSLRSWLMVGSGLMVVWSIRHPYFLIRWTKRGLGLRSIWRMVRGILRQSPTHQQPGARTPIPAPRSAISPSDTIRRSRQPGPSPQSVVSPPQISIHSAQPPDIRTGSSPRRQRISPHRTYCSGTLKKIYSFPC